MSLLLVGAPVWGRSQAGSSLEDLPLKLALFGTSAYHQDPSTPEGEALAIFLGRRGQAWEWALLDRSAGPERWSRLRLTPHREWREDVTADFFASQGPSKDPKPRPALKRIERVRISGILEFSKPLHESYRKMKVEVFFVDMPNREQNCQLDIQRRDAASGREMLWTLTSLPWLSSPDGSYQFCPSPYPELCAPDAYAKLKARALQMKLD